MSCFLSLLVLSNRKYVISNKCSNITSNFSCTSVGNCNDWLQIRTSIYVLWRPWLLQSSTFYLLIICSMPTRPPSSTPTKSILMMIIICTFSVEHNYWNHIVDIRMRMLKYDIYCYCCWYYYEHYEKTAEIIYNLVMLVSMMVLLLVSMMLILIMVLMLVSMLEWVIFIRIGWCCKY